jgi:hypothetical protein
MARHSAIRRDVGGRTRIARGQPQDLTRHCTQSVAQMNHKFAASEIAGIPFTVLDNLVWLHAADSGFFCVRDAMIVNKAGLRLQASME